MKKSYQNFLFIVLVLHHLSVDAQDQTTLLLYSLDGSIAPAYSTGGLDAGNLQAGPGVTGVFPDYSSVSVDGSSLLFLNAGFNSITQEGAIDTQRYLGFSITVEPDYRIDLSGLSLYTLRRTGGGEDHGLGAPSAYALWISARGFESVVASGAIPGNTTDEFHRIDIDIGRIDELQSVSGTVEFRLYLWASEGLATPSQRQLRIDNIILTGMDTEQVLIPVTEGEWQVHPKLGWVYVFTERPNWVYSGASASWFYLPPDDEQGSAENWFHAP